jgi:hypothetical protein
MQTRRFEADLSDTRGRGAPGAYLPCACGDRAQGKA